MTPLENYLRELREIRSTGAGVEEESYYHPLATLFDELGKKLKPRVKCVLQLANRGAGKPDGGLFAADQFEKRSAELQPGQLPARGAIEVKPTKDDAWVTAEAKQVTKYWNRYRQVLVTNYRDFVLVGQDADGNAAILETYRLAESEKTFWQSAASARATADKQNDRFVEYLQRVMRYAAAIAAPEDVAWFLASYARDALAGIRDVELSALAAVREALEEALGLKFEGDKGEHFFRSSLIQTLFYGIFSAWVLWSRHNPPTSRKRFDWRLTAWSLRVPMISRLFSLIADPRQLDALKLSEVLDWTGAVLNRVDRASFFSKFEESHAVQYFYEPFLEAFDPELRKQLGVWYTPPEVVKYMVERVDTVLREELGLPLGLADKNVYVLDPCCGTGSYLVEVLDRVHRTLKERGEDALTVSDLKEAAQKRIFGFEILPAPFVVSHLQLGLLLQKLGVPLSEKSRDRVAVYLTNSLTGWEPPKVPKTKLMFPELEEERDAAEHVKREIAILVILGNPPYNAFAGVSPAEEQGLVEPYKEGLISEWGIKKFNLDDLYVRFFRLAERRIVEGKPGRGVVCYISNFSYLSDPSYVVMRERFLKEFDRLWFDCMNGDSRETGKLTPEGKPDPSVFSTERNREGIRIGTAIGLLVRAGTRPALTDRSGANVSSAKKVRFRHFWGVAKKSDLVESLGDPDLEARYRAAQPEKVNRYSFVPEAVTGHYRDWPRTTDLCKANYNGPVERRNNSLIVFRDRRKQLELVADYLDPEKSDEAIRILVPAFMESSGEFDAEKTRKALKEKMKKKQVKYDESRIVPYPFKPFDVRLAYLDASIQPLFSRPGPQLLAQCGVSGNAFFITRDTADTSPEGPPFYFSNLVCDYDFISGHARHFPMQVVATPRKKKIGHPAQAEMPHAAAAVTPPSEANLSSEAREYLKGLAVGGPDADPQVGVLIWMHALAIGYSPAYLSENADGIRQDWPRIPLPDSKELLLASAALGRKIAALLDTETVAEAVGQPPLQKIAVPTRTDGKPFREGDHDEQGNDLAVTAGWGHAGKDGVTMPGKGKLIERDYTPEEFASFSGHSMLLGDRTCDVYLNEVAYWKNIPLRVWKYTIGGYQVIKKWLSYREQKLLGRPMTKDEVRWVQEMARRISAILLLEPALDENYRAVKARTYEWPKSA
jgi:Type ISP C-terminal specificity domain/N-6 DNA Methylase